MKSGPFISLVSDAYGVPEPTVRQYARVLKEAGLFTSGARGVNAPDITPHDAARITIAMLATASPKASPDLVSSCGKFIQIYTQFFFDFDLKVNLEDSLASFFVSDQEFSITYRQDSHNFQIFSNAQKAVYDSDNFWPDREIRDWKGGIRLTRTLMHTELTKISELFKPA